MVWQIGRVCVEPFVPASLCCVGVTVFRCINARINSQAHQHMHPLVAPNQLIPRPITVTAVVST